MIPDPVVEWCDRRLLARIHRYTLNRLRAEIEPVTAADFLRFLLHWQHVAGDQKVRGPDGLAAVVEQLDGCEVPAASWELDVLPARCADYEPQYLDSLCLSGRVTWGRRSPMNGNAKVPLRRSPVAIMLRDRASIWASGQHAPPEDISPQASAVLGALQQRGASFFHELVTAARLLRPQVERALAELAGAGLVTSDSYSGLRALLSNGRQSARYGVDTAGRWGLLGKGEMSEAVSGGDGVGDGGGGFDGGARTEAIARALLKRYGVVFRSLLARETGLPPWRELVMVYRRLEARGEIRGGRFVHGFGGEQFALPDAVGRLRSVRKLERSGEFIAISAADPLNLVGIVTPDARVPAITRNRVLFRDGVAIAALEAGQVRRLAESGLDDHSLRMLLGRRATPPIVRAYLTEGRQTQLA